MNFKKKKNLFRFFFLEIQDQEADPEKLKRDQEERQRVLQ
jgi:hypothetical protein